MRFKANVALWESANGTRSLVNENGGAVAAGWMIVILV